MAEHRADGATLLVVEDDPDLLPVLKRILSGAGFRIQTAKDGEEALKKALEGQPNLVVIDVGLPLRNGVEVTRELRDRGFQAPMLMLTALGSLNDRVTGFDAGADDYLPKPFEPAELLARVKALLRRSSITGHGSVLQVRDLTLNAATRRVERAGKRIELTQKEYALLEYLMRHAGRPMARQAITEHVWKQQDDPLTNVVDVYINYLRKKIDDDKDDPLIRTVRGVGYMIKG
ncbi:MAG: response regulator transcription factor [Gemmatimonadaceae bacterium]